MTSLSELNEINITTDKQAFEVISKHLISQGDKSEYYGGDCAYRGKTDEEYDAYDNLISGGEPTGKSCAVGCIIKDDCYMPELEGLAIDDAHVQQAVSDSHPEWHITPRSLSLLKAFQIIHDTKNIDDWRKYIQALGELLDNNNIPDDWDVLLTILEQEYLSLIKKEEE